MLENVGHREGDLGGDGKRIIITIEGSDDVRIADGDAGERLSAVHQNRFTLVVATSLGGAAALGGIDGELGATSISQHVGDGLISPLEWQVEVDLDSP